MEQFTNKVYASLTSAGNILAINSDSFLADTTGWTLIDEGAGDRYHHAQGNYLPSGLYTSDGIPRYKWDGTQVVERTSDEIAADRAAIPAPEVQPTAQELMDAILELGEIITGGT